MTVEIQGFYTNLQNEKPVIVKVVAAVETITVVVKVTAVCSV
jgi:hypothetical protein